MKHFFFLVKSILTRQTNDARCALEEAEVDSATLKTLEGDELRTGGHSAARGMQMKDTEMVTSRSCEIRIKAFPGFVNLMYLLSTNG